MPSHLHRAFTVCMVCSVDGFVTDRSCDGMSLKERGWGAI